MVGGQALVKQAKLRKILSEVNHYKVAFNAFNLEYNAVPGDFNSATSYWPGQTNNGTGNKRVTSLPQFGVRFEPALFWQHLSLAGLFNNNLINIGVGGGSGRGAIEGNNMPMSSLNIGGYIPLYPNSSEDSGYSNWNYWQFENLNRHFLLLAEQDNPSTPYRLSMGPVMTVKDAANIDNKIDDGLPDTGIVGNLVPSHNSLIYSACRVGALTVGGQGNSNEYNLTNTDAKACAMIFSL